MIALVALVLRFETDVGRQPLPSQDKDLLGAWEGEKKSFLRFEADRVTILRDGQVSYLRAVYKEGRVVTSTWGLKSEMKWTVQDGVLTLDGKDAYRRVEKFPEEVEPRPLELGKADALDESAVQALREELARRAAEDQAVRKDRSRQKEMGKVDAANTERLIEIVKKHGWVDATRFGARAAGEAFLLVQHSAHLPLMMAALPKIEEDVKAGRLDPQGYALLHDRMQVMLGRKQRYGTQIGSDNEGRMIVLATEDPQNVEKRRKEIGLFPLKTYLSFFKEQNGGKEPAFEEE
jgi:hypothetical protein